MTACANQALQLFINVAEIQGIPFELNINLGSCCIGKMNNVQTSYLLLLRKNTTTTPNNRNHWLLQKNNVEQQLVTRLAKFLPAQTQSTLKVYFKIRFCFCTSG